MCERNAHVRSGGWADGRCPMSRAALEEQRAAKSAGQLNPRRSEPRTRWPSLSCTLGASALRGAAAAGLSQGVSLPILFLRPAWAQGPPFAIWMVVLGGGLGGLPTLPADKAIKQPSGCCAHLPTQAARDAEGLLVGCTTGLATAALLCFLACPACLLVCLRAANLPDHPGFSLLAGCVCGCAGEGVWACGLTTPRRNTGGAA